MNTEDRLRDAISAYTDPIEPAPDAWRRIRERVDAEPRVRRFRGWQLSLAGFATATAIALVVALLALPGDDDGNGPSIGSPGQGIPDRVVAVTEDGRVVVLDIATGREVRTLADGADLQTTLAAGSDGTVFFDVPAENNCGGREIVRVPLEGGGVEGVAPNSSMPALSPDGELLAFLSYQESAGCALASSLVVQPADPDPTRSAGRGWAVAPGQTLALLSWAPDSRHLAFGLVDGDTFSTQELDTATAGALSDARPLAAPVTAGWGYLGTTGEFVTVRNGRAVALDPASGATLRDLFAFDPELEIGRITSDSSGRHFLFERETAEGGPAGVFRAAVGDAEPTKVADGIVSAAWVPEQRGTLEPPPQPELPPTTPCGVDVPFLPTILPEGFVRDQVPGSPPGVPVSVYKETPAILYYTDGSEGLPPRSIVVRHPGRPSPPLAGATSNEITVLGRQGTIRPATPDRGRGATVFVEFALTDDATDDPCARWSLDGYGVTEAELRSFAEGLVVATIVATSPVRQ